MSAKDIEVTSLSAIEHIVEFAPKRIRVIRAPQKKDGRVGAIIRMAQENSVPLDLSLGQSRDEAIATLHPFSYTELSTAIEEAADRKHTFLVALDHIQDSQNLGALCRSAEGLGAQGIILPKDRSVSVNSGAYTASVGAVETLPIIAVTNLGEALRKLKAQNFWIVGSTLGPDSQYPETVPDFDKMVLVLGSELEGMSSGLEKLCDWKVKIPLEGKVQSLNVSAAGAILIYELLQRQRGPQRTTN